MLARSLPGICSEFARNLLGTRSSPGICSEFARKTARTSHARNSPRVFQKFREGGSGIRSEALQNESFPNIKKRKSSRICPEFCSKCSPRISRTFRASFRGRRRPVKIHQRSPPFFNAKFPGKHEKKTFTKFFCESRLRGSGKGVFA